MHGLSARLCSVPCRCGRGSRFVKARSAPRLCQRTDFVHARHTFICEKYLMLHVLLHDQKYQKSSKPFPLRNLPVSSRPAKARTIYTLLCEHIERTVRPQAKQGVQAQMSRCLLDFALCHADTAGVHAFSSVSAQTSYTPATPLYAGVEQAHTRICSATSCDVFARVV